MAAKTIPRSPQAFELGDLYLAYRQAKGSFWSERRGIDLLPLARFEANLAANLQALHPKLGEPSRWFDKLDIGRPYLTPKAMSHETLPPMSIITVGNSKRNTAATLDVRVQLAPSPDFAIAEVLYLWAFGPLLDSVLPGSSVGYRLDVRKGSLSRDRQQFFQYWPERYRHYRTAPLRAARKELSKGDNKGSCFVASLDLTSFYDSVDPSFLLSNSFIDELKSSPLYSSASFDIASYREATASLLRSYDLFWYAASRLTGIYADRGLPIGSILSRLIANIALSTCDRHIEKHPDVIHYRRYVDDMLIVARAEGKGPSLSLSDTLKRWLPISDVTAESLGLNTDVLDRPGSRLTLQLKKVKLYHLEGLEGLDFLTVVAADLERLSSERRAFVDSELLGRSHKIPLSAAGPGFGSRLRVLRDADQVHLEHLSLGTALATLSRAARLLDAEEARKLVKRAVEPIVRLLRNCDDWAAHLEAIFRVLGLCLLVQERPIVRQLVSIIDQICERILEQTLELRWNRQPILERMARRSLCEFLHLKRRQSICAAYPLDYPAHRRMLRGEGLAVLSATETEENLRHLSTLLSKADLRLLDREDESARYPALPSFDQSELDKDLSTSKVPGLARRLTVISSFVDRVKRLRDPVWDVSASSLFLSPRPPKYFDIARRVLHSADSEGIANDVFDDLLEIVNAVRGTQYRDAVARRLDASTVDISGSEQWTDATHTRIIIGNLAIDEKWWKAAAQGREVLEGTRTAARLRSLAEVLRKAQKAARQHQRRTGQRALLSLPELSLPRAWLRDVGNTLTREPSLALIVGLEYRRHPAKPGVLNQVIGIFPGPCDSAFVWIWTKRRPAREEAASLIAAGTEFATVAPPSCERTVVQSEFGALSVLVCSEIIDAQLVGQLVGRTEILVVPAWNRDTGSYDHLVQSLGLQLNSFVVVANNGSYSDCRVWAPRRERWEREYCRLIQRSGREIVYVDIPIGDLRQFRRDSIASALDAVKGTWKPLPPNWPR